MRASFSLGIPRVAAVVALRHPLLDGHTFVVHESVPEKEWEQSDKHSAIGRVFRFENYRRPFGPRVIADAQKKSGCQRCVSALNSEALRAAYTPTDLVSSSAMDHTLTISTVPAF